MALTAEQAQQLSYLTAIHTGSQAIALIAQVSSVEPWSETDGTTLWLPFVDWLIPLLRPIPLGDRRLLQGWLPQRPQHHQLLNLEGLQNAVQLSDLLLAGGACCDLNRAAAAVVTPAGRAA